MNSVNGDFDTAFDADAELHLGKERIDVFGNDALKCEHNREFVENFAHGDRAN